jgi:hypothetical protein
MSPKAPSNTTQFAQIRSRFIDEGSLKKDSIVDITERSYAFAKLSMVKNNGVSLYGLRLVVYILKIIRIRQHS